MMYNKIEEEKRSIRRHEDKPPSPVSFSVDNSIFGEILDRIDIFGVIFEDSKDMKTEDCSVSPKMIDN